jgi:hypothetical protein
MRSMKKLLVWAAILTVVAVIAGPAVSAPRTRATDAIWLLNSQGARLSSTTLRSGETFSAGWQSSRTEHPWGLAQCWAGGSSAPFWSSYRALQGDGTIGVFELASADPNASWPSGGATCTVSLVVTQGNKQVVTATSDTFGVSA